MTLAKGITQASLFGIASGTLLATTSLFWLNPTNSFYLPLFVAFWWLVIFGLNLWHAYTLSLKPIANSLRFSYQVVHAALAAAVFFGIDVFAGKVVWPSISNETNSMYLSDISNAQIDSLLNNTLVIVAAAFILSLLTGGLLYSILSRPAAK